MKNRMWIAAAALAAAVVFLVMVTGEGAPAAPRGAPAPVASSGAVLASDGGPPDNGDGATGADREEIVDALQDLLDALGISAEELADCADDAQAQPGADGTEGNGGGNDGGGGKDGGNGGDCGKPGAAAEPAAGGTITIAAFAFGQPLTVGPGATVEVVNTDAAPHNVTAGDGSFETPDLNQDETATFTAPTTPGRYEFSCTLHPEMTGTLIVAGDATGSSAESRAGDQGRARPTEPAEGRQRSGAGTSGGDHDAGSQQHSTTPSRGTADGY